VVIASIDFSFRSTQSWLEQEISAFDKMKTNCTVQEDNMVATHTRKKKLA
jgi:hypothetical protein